MRNAVSLAVLVTVLFVVALSADGEQILGMQQEKFMSLVYLGVILASAGAFVVFSRISLGETGKYALIWAGIFMGLIVLYTFKENGSIFSGQLAGELSPGRAVSGEGDEVTIVSNKEKEFIVNAEVNGQQVSFIFDTGADIIALTYETAEQLGLKVSSEDFIMTMHTANGQTKSAPVLLKYMTIGSITFNNVRAGVSQQGALHQNLLGRTFLDRLNSYEVRGSRLILRKN